MELKHQPTRSPLVGNRRTIRQETTGLQAGALTSKVKQVNEVLNAEKPTNYILGIRGI
jgi:hypothetical protein